MRRLWWGGGCVLDTIKCAKANAKCPKKMAWNMNRCKCEHKSCVSLCKPGYVKRVKKFGCLCVKKTKAHNFKSYKSTNYNPVYEKQAPVTRIERVRAKPKTINVCDKGKVYNTEE